jgi:L,D-transpeptidase YbiS
MVERVLDRAAKRAAVIAGGRPWIEVDVGRQQLSLRRGEQTLAEYPISTARNGVGEQEGSGCTPQGWHVIRARIGDGLPLNSVFVGRRFTGEIYSPALAAAYPQRDWILTRILWLSGSEPGVNRLGARDSMRRYIYIHGCPDSCPMGRPESAGCVRMRNQELVELFSHSFAGMPVLIHE